MKTIQKENWKPGTMLAPVPVVMVTCQAKGRRPNIITVAWVGTVCSEPPMLSISVRPSRYSYPLIKDSGEFVVNIPSSSLADIADKCGVISGSQVNKIAETGLTMMPAKTVNAPIIAECPVNIECKVKQHIALGTHVLFLAEITGVQVSSHLITGDGKLDLEKAGLITFAHGNYYALGKYLGHFGFSVRKKTSKHSRNR